MAHLRSTSLTYLAVRIVLLGTIGLFGAAPHLRADEGPEPASIARPNILWLLLDDVSPHFGCYGHTYAKTPNIDALALRSIRYTRVFAPTGVCATSRSSLITGLFASSLGTQQMRSEATLPERIRPFPFYLRNAGYYTANRGRTDYNFVVPTGVWDSQGSRAHWRGRRPDQPFFAILNFTTTHESRIRGAADVFARLSADQRHAPEEAQLPPYLPDTAVVRKDWASYHDLITLFDRFDLTTTLNQLEEDGLSDDTIIFLFADHGVGLPRAKQFIFDSGMQVPLIIHFPPKWRHLAPAPPGTVRDELVSFVDFAGSTLSLAGLPMPPELQGIPFLGPTTTMQRDRIHGIRDRMDERIDMSRTVRDSRWKFHRNYLPHLPHYPWLTYMDLLGTSKDLRRLSTAGKLTGGLRYFMGPRKRLEELYDIAIDPYELENLVDDPRHQEVLSRLREEHFAWVRTTRDTGFIPEQMLRDFAQGSSEYEYAGSQNYHLERCIQAVRLMEQGASALPLIERLLEDPYGPVRYWAAAGLINLGSQAQPAIPSLIRALHDPHAEVAVIAAEALCYLGHAAPALPILTRYLQDDRPLVCIAAANVISRIGEQARPLMSLIRTQSKASTLRPDRFLLMVDWLMAETLRNLGEPVPHPVIN